ncbi:class I SAM-dependent methyltransferase [Bacillus marinisedimentorum]|uniref:class I SAM-dependent methyltransferase n=1 Tax=Bacillus marinisedimentorum TaxID=1821260 RepID=UPI0007E2A27A|nr:class I SAM-dependent methyltransferase [Bacillus marinisedimentorum]
MDFFEIHQGLPREGPGDNESTAFALRMLRNLPSEVRILDVGCGPGMQTIALARQIDGKITALDTHQPFLDVLAANAEQAGMADKIEPINGSMFELDFPKESFDAIWSEGAIYILGFERGLQEWREFLKPGGYVAVTELSWLRKDVPEEPRRVWAEDYPGMKGIADNIKIIEESGYVPVGHFVLPESSWWENYYLPLLQRIGYLREKAAGDPGALARLDESEKEIDLYRNYSDYYGYVFYMMRKV